MESRTGLGIAVTGADGFVGRHVVAVATARGHKVTRVIHRPRLDSQSPDDVTGVDLTKGWPDVKVDAVIHLAALASVGPSFDRPMDYVTSNAAMVVNMCEELLRRAPATRVIMASSGAIYATSTTPISEEAPISFTSPYAVGKVLGENLLDYYRLMGIESTSVRPFNHIGPGQRPGFLVPDLVSRLKSLPQEGVLEVGNLSTRRDYTDVRDVALAYVLLAECDRVQAPVYNVCSGVTRSGDDVLSEICTALGRPVPRLAVAEWATRPIDNPVVLGDAGRIRRELGWQPRIGFEESIRDALREDG